MTVRNSKRTSHLDQPTLIAMKYGPRREITGLQGSANNKGADQSAHPRSLISAFVFIFLEGTISELASSEISIFKLVSVAAQAGLNLTLSETPMTGFLATRPKYDPVHCKTNLNDQGDTKDSDQPGRPHCLVKKVSTMLIIKTVHSIP